MSTGIHNPPAESSGSHPAKLPEGLVGWLPTQPASILPVLWNQPCAGRPWIECFTRRASLPIAFGRRNRYTPLITVKRIEVDNFAYVGDAPDRHSSIPNNTHLDNLPACVCRSQIWVGLDAADCVLLPALSVLLPAIVTSSMTRANPGKFGIHSHHAASKTNLFVGSPPNNNFSERVHANGTQCLVLPAWKELRGSKILGR